MANEVQKHDTGVEASEFGGDVKKVHTILDGTTQMFDEGRLRLIPTPSSHPDDPLNISRTRKGLAIFAVCFFGAITIAMQQMIAGLLPIFMLEYAGIDPKVLNNGGLGAVFANMSGPPPGMFPGGPGGIPGGGISPGVPTSVFSGGVPTFTPTGISINISSNIANGIPASIPISIPAGVSSSPPTGNFSGIPSGIPTGLPSGTVPSGFPQGIPSSVPSGIPSGIPTAIPSGIRPGDSLNGSSGFPGSGPPPGAFSGNPLEALGNLPGAQPLNRVNLLVSLPMLFVGISNYILGPAAAAYGRRAVMLFCGLLATLCTVWSGLSTSLESHIASRCLQAFAAGSVESLVPLILQDMTFVHQRSRIVSALWASQGIMTISLGIGSSYIVARTSWRWLYFIGAIITALSALCLIAFLPETRWHRTPEELRGEARPSGQQALDTTAEGHRLRSRYGVFANGGVNFKDGIVAAIELGRTLALPVVFYLVLINAAFIGVSLGSSTTMSTVLLAPPYNWPFETIGLTVVAPFISSIFVMLIGGNVSDMVVNRLAKRNGGKREAEMNLWNMIFPLFCGVVGCLLFGAGGQYVDRVHWMAILSATAILVFAFLTANVVASVTAIESYPRLAGPVLVNVASFRNIIGFAFTYGIPSWVATRGYMGAFSIFAGVIAFLSLFLPVFLIYGKRLRSSTRLIAESVGYSL